MQRHRQSAGAQQQRQVAGLLSRKTAADFAAAAGNDAANHWRGNHLIVENDGQGSADVVPGYLTKQLGSLAIELEGDHRLASVGAEGHLRITDTLTCHGYAAFESVALLAIGTGNYLGICVITRVRQSLPVKQHLGRCAQQRANLVGIGHAWHLHQNAVFTLTRNTWLNQAGFIQTTPHDFQAALYRIL